MSNCQLSYPGIGIVRVTIGWGKGETRGGWDTGSCTFLLTESLIYKYRLTKRTV